MIDELLKNCLNLNPKSIDWVRALVRLCFHDDDALDFIGNELDIPTSKLAFWKAICG